MSEVIVGISTDTGGSLEPIPANTLLGNNTGSPALPIGLTTEQVRTLLSAQETFSTLITGNLNVFVVEAPTISGQQANFFFQSHNGEADSNFGIASIVANAEEGVQIFAKGNGLSDPLYNIQVFAGGYAVAQPAAFRTAISAAEASHTHDISTLNWATIYARTTNPGIAGQPWNDSGTLRFSNG